MNQYDEEVEAALSGWGAPFPVYFPATAADIPLFGPECRLCGWTIVETAGAVATVDLVEGYTSNGAPVATLSLAAAGRSEMWLGDGGVICRGGLSLDRLTGTVRGVVWVRAPRAS